MTQANRDTGGLAAVFAHPDDESFGCAGALALAHDAGRITRLLLVTRGIRDYCNAYHNGSNRKALIDLLVSSKTETRPELLNKFPWPARNLTGKLNAESMLDIQDWYLKHKFITAKFPIERLVDYSYTDYAQKQLGPFVLENKDSKLSGCR